MSGGAFLGSLRKPLWGFILAAQGTYAPGPYNIEDSFAITEDGDDRFTKAPDSLVWDGSIQMVAYRKDRVIFLQRNLGNNYL